MTSFDPLLKCHFKSCVLEGDGDRTFFVRLGRQIQPRLSNKMEFHLDFLNLHLIKFKVLTKIWLLQDLKELDDEWEPSLDDQRLSRKQCPFQTHELLMRSKYAV